MANYHSIRMRPDLTRPEATATFSFVACCNEYVKAGFFPSPRELEYF